MEGDNEETGGGSIGVPVSSRWNPTKEQINILENMYKQGIRTPSAEQIQQITSRLKVYGHIEGKNVFYWFQNHKARQRQKQKQESLAYFNRFVHRNPQPFPCPNVVCNPYYMHQNDVGFYPQYHSSQVFQTSGMVRMRSMKEYYDSEEYSGNPTCENEAINVEICEKKKETLSLFPTHPTGDLQEGPPVTASPSFRSDESPSFDHSGIQGGFYSQTHFDFFCRQGS